jgi:hypothetical protein
MQIERVYNGRGLKRPLYLDPPKNSQEKFCYQAYQLKLRKENFNSKKTDQINFAKEAKLKDIIEIVSSLQ